MEGLGLSLSKAELEEDFRLRHGEAENHGWGPRMRFRFGYFTPDVFYEALAGKLISSGTTWLDVGCGRNIFPGNEQLARILSARCSLLVGVDPDETIRQNPYVHRRPNVRSMTVRATKLLMLSLCAWSLNISRIPRLQFRRWLD